MDSRDAGDAGRTGGVTSKLEENVGRSDGWRPGVMKRSGCI